MNVAARGPATWCVAAQINIMGMIEMITIMTMDNIDFIKTPVTDIVCGKVSISSKNNY